MAAAAPDRVLVVAGVPVVLVLPLVLVMLAGSVAARSARAAGDAAASSHRLSRASDTLAADTVSSVVGLGGIAPGARGVERAVRDPSEGDAPPEPVPLVLLVPRDVLRSFSWRRHWLTRSGALCIVGRCVPRCHEDGHVVLCGRACGGKGHEAKISAHHSYVTAHCSAAAGHWPPKASDAHHRVLGEGCCLAGQRVRTRGVLSLRRTNHEPHTRCWCFLSRRGCEYQWQAWHQCAACIVRQWPQPRAVVCPALLRALGRLRTECSAAHLVTDLWCTEKQQSWRVGEAKVASPQGKPLSRLKPPQCFFGMSSSQLYAEPMVAQKEHRCYWLQRSANMHRQRLCACSLLSLLCFSLDCR